jgi:hypothetical protein
MKTFKTSLEDAPSEIKMLYQGLLEGYDHYLVSNPDSGFMEYFGGYIYVLESLDELKEIDTGTMHPCEDRFLNLSEASDVFDICEWVCGHTYVHVMNITSNSGGASYFIPRPLALQHRYLLDSIHESASQMEIL